MQIMKNLAIFRKKNTGKFYTWIESQTPQKQMIGWVMHIRKNKMKH